MFQKLVSVPRFYYILSLFGWCSKGSDIGTIRWQEGAEERSKKVYFTAVVTNSEAVFEHFAEPCLLIEKLTRI